MLKVREYRKVVTGSSVGERHERRTFDLHESMSAVPGIQIYVSHELRGLFTSDRAFVLYTGLFTAIAEPGGVWIDSDGRYMDRDMKRLYRAIARIRPRSKRYLQGRVKHTGGERSVHRPSRIQIDLLECQSYDPARGGYGRGLGKVVRNHTRSWTDSRRIAPHFHGRDCRGPS